MEQNQLDKLLNLTYTFCMKFANKLLFFVFSLSTLFLVIISALQEFEVLYIENFSLIFVAGLLVWCAMPLFFYMIYVKNKDKVKAIKQKYLDDLKPKSPIRFCPSDEELLRKFRFELENSKEEVVISKDQYNQTNKTYDNVEKNQNVQNNQDELEMDM